MASEKEAAKKKATKKKVPKKKVTETRDPEVVLPPIAVLPPSYFFHKNQEEIFQDLYERCEKRTLTRKEITAVRNYNEILMGIGTLDLATFNGKVEWTCDIEKGSDLQTAHGLRAARGIVVDCGESIYLYRLFIIDSKTDNTVITYRVRMPGILRDSDFLSWYALMRYEWGIGAEYPF